MQKLNDDIYTPKSTCTFQHAKLNDDIYNLCLLAFFLFKIKTLRRPTTPQ